MISDIIEKYKKIQEIMYKKINPITYEEIYTDKDKNGTFKAYYDTGQLEAEGQLSAGVINGRIVSYFKNKSTLEPLRVYRDITYLQHEDIYSYKEYYESGELYSEQSFMKNIPHGLIRFYHKNGKIAMESFFDNGNMIGSFKEFNENGTIIIDDTL